MTAMADEAPAELPCASPMTPDPWTAELVRLRQVELRQAERLVAASQAVVARMDRRLAELRRLRRRADALRRTTQR
jgi:hypothetical protein